jgi:hypothetical protein
MSWLYASAVNHGGPQGLDDNSHSIACRALQHSALLSLVYGSMRRSWKHPGGLRCRARYFPVAAAHPVAQPQPAGDCQGLGHFHKSSSMHAAGDACAVSAPASAVRFLGPVVCMTSSVLLCLMRSIALHTSIFTPAQGPAGSCFCCHIGALRLVQRRQLRGQCTLSATGNDGYSSTTRCLTVAGLARMSKEGPEVPEIITPSLGFTNLTEADLRGVGNTGLESLTQRLSGCY